MKKSMDQAAYFIIISSDLIVGGEILLVLEGNTLDSYAPTWTAYPHPHPHFVNVHERTFLVSTMYTSIHERLLSTKVN